MAVKYRTAYVYVFFIPFATSFPTLKNFSLLNNLFLRYLIMSSTFWLLINIHFLTMYSLSKILDSDENSPTASVNTTMYQRSSWLRMWQCFIFHLCYFVFLPSMLFYICDRILLLCQSKSIHAFIHQTTPNNGTTNYPTKYP